MCVLTTIPSRVFGFPVVDEHEILRSASVVVVVVV